MIATAFFWAVIIVWCTIGIALMSGEYERSKKLGKKISAKEFVSVILIFYSVPVLMIWLKTCHEGWLFWAGAITFFGIWPLVKALKDWNNSNR